MSDSWKPQNHVPYLRLGWLRVNEVREWNASDSLQSWCRDLSERASQPAHLAEQERLREGVRALLRRGGYKPSGRNKPAQEYLQRCLREGTGLPVIFPAVDVLNATSVWIGLPISMLGLRYFPDGLQVRLGLPGESFVFNAAGQTLEVEGLIVACGGEQADIPLGSPVKDSMAGKIEASDRDLICLIYAPADAVSEEAMREMSEELGKNLEKWTGCQLISWGSA